jgi:hypothetical protein
MKTKKFKLGLLILTLSFTTWIMAEGIRVNRMDKLDGQHLVKKVDKPNKEFRLMSGK